MKTRNYLLRIFSILMLIALFLSFSACKKTVESNSGVIPLLTTKTPTLITESTATVGGFVSSDGGTSVTERGICYSVNANPTIADLAVNQGSGVGNFQCVITGLSPNSNYYIRAYALNSSGVGYGNQEAFTTLKIVGAPSVTTLPVSNISNTTAICGGNVVSAGTATVTTRGVCWSTSQLPVASGMHTSDSSGTGSYTSQITGLTSNTSYYLRAYAINSIGTSYGSQINFTTTGSGGTVPVLTTAGIINITEATATSGGNVTSPGSTAVTSRGVCWSTLPNPTTTDEHTSNGSGTGSFTSNMAGLSPLTTYYVRAYAVNSIGVAYGEMLSFTTTDPGPCPSTLIFEGKTYHTVEINRRCWFKENLNVGTRINGSQTQNGANDSIEKYCYDDLESNCEIYGGLYQWDEMMQGSATPGDQGICPPEWHVPTDIEYTDLVDFLGGDSVAGGKLKKTGTDLWKTPNNGATNESGFTALPGGYRDNSSIFRNITTSGIFWSSTQGETTIAWYRSLYYSSVSIGRYSGMKTTGSSVRCVKDGILK